MQEEPVRAGRIGSWYLKRQNSLTEVCKNLAASSVNYVLLPAATGDGRALLVDDKDTGKLARLITRIPTRNPIAIYSYTDLPGFGFQQHWRDVTDATNMAVLPPYLAQGILERGQVDERGIRVPCPRDIQLWAAYCALYLRGNTGFSTSGWDDGSAFLLDPSASTMIAMGHDGGRAAGQKVALSFLDRLVEDGGWGPTTDLLRRFSQWNRWAAFKLQRLNRETPPEGPGFVAFFMRSQVLAEGLDDDLASLLEDYGFELLKTISLDEDQRKRATRSTRGANWGPGAHPISGGTPGRVIFAFDLYPLPVPSAFQCNYPFLDNARVLRAKQACRDHIYQRLPAHRRFNPIHATDDSREAWSLVRLLAPECEVALRDTIEKRRAAFATHFEVLEDFTRTAFRAKVELIRYGGGVAVKKTWKQTCLRFMEREASIMDQISPMRAEILPVLERGDNYVIMPFVEGRSPRRRVLGRGLPQLLTIQQVSQLKDLILYLLQRGFDPVDLAPHNLLCLEGGGFKVIDLEFAYRSDRPVAPRESACLNGIPADFRGDIPRPLRRHGATDGRWHSTWFGCVGLSLNSFLYDPVAIQRLKRCVNYPLFLVTRTYKTTAPRLTEALKQTVKRSFPGVSRLMRSMFA